jgi:hypothetical protein
MNCPAARLRGIEWKFERSKLRGIIPVEIKKHALGVFSMYIMLSYPIYDSLTVKDGL